MSDIDATSLRFWAIVPAAGIGARMGAPLPKQYLKIQGRYILDLTLERLLLVPALAGVVVALAPDDTLWLASEYAGDPRIKAVTGGADRASSVLAVLNTLPAADHDWALVHDAARPCVLPANVTELISAVTGSDGGLLAMPVAETVKRVVNGTVTATLDRRELWTAQTPQAFPVAKLRQWLTEARDQGVVLTDEASAAERAAIAPLVVSGRSDNIKITHPEDLALAAMILERQRQDGLL